MPQLHLTKVAFGCRDLDALRTRVAARAEGSVLRVATRMRPKRAAMLSSRAASVARSEAGGTARQLARGSSTSDRRNARARDIGLWRYQAPRARANKPGLEG